MMRIVPGAGPLGQLPPQEWMDAPETRAVIAALTAEGGEVRFVGGCVRDAVLRRPIKDVDIATRDTPERVMQLLEKAGLRAIPTGVAHGTVTAVAGTAHFEITTLREDVETFGRHARVAFTDDWRADAARRDFTMNAMFADPQGRIYDPQNGLADLGEGAVRFVGDPFKRIEEDVLRLLRFFRFFAHYGRPPMDRIALAACRRMAPRLAQLSGERVAGELLRLLEATDPTSVLLTMHGNGVLEPILPEAAAFGRLRVLTWLESRAMIRPDLGPDRLRRLAAVLDTDAAGIDAVAERLKLSAVQRGRLAGIVVPSARLSADMDDVAARQALYRMGVTAFQDVLLVTWAGERAVEARVDSARTARWSHLLDIAAHWRAPEFPVRGADVLDLGVMPGPAVGEALAEVEQWWRDGDFQADRDQCLGRLRDVVASPR